MRASPREQFVRLLLTFVIALSVTMALLPLLVMVAKRLGFLDVPGERKVHSSNTPRVGGIAMVTGMLLATMLVNGNWRDLTLVLVAIVVIAIFGAWDDHSNLDFRLKFLGQIAASLLVILAANVVIMRVPFWHAEALPLILAVPLTLFALLGTTNAVNLADGLDGLAGGMMLISFGAIAALGRSAGDAGVTIMAVAAMGGILGFLRFNTHPASVFMGDAGSQALGFIAGVLSILLTRTDSALSPVLPLFLLGLPILDTVLVMVRRIREGRSPFRPDNNHIHHRLLRLGFDKHEAVVMIYVVHATIVATGFVLRDRADELLMVVYLGFCIVVIGALVLATRSGLRFRGRPVAGRASPETQRRTPSAGRARLARWVFGYLLVSVPGYALTATTWSQNVTREMGETAVLLCVVLLAMYFSRRGEPLNVVERAGLYVVGAYAMYLAQALVAAHPWLEIGDNVFFVLLALAVTAAVSCCWRERFSVNSQDFLVLFMALMITFMSSEYFRLFDQRLALIKLVVLYYAIELLLYRYVRRADALRLAAIAGFAALGVRGLF
jgi:UDP-GlcNAc:undecaprenyl-phosphate GlcNAc-1-phosphate transferase